MAIRLEKRADTDGSFLLIPVGDLDRDAAEALSTAVGECLAHPPGRLVIQMTHVQFCDSSGIVALLDAHAEAAGRGTELVLADVSEHLRALFRISALDQVVRIVEESRG
ncbi:MULTISPECIES: STAS domain-containing protein [Streptosporangium]|uniref:Anti-sigma factor antagonist n=1 Tax=Streptosporangium brasiliense TaxID=47480 RepID=A0ABT9R9L3_9ACTN|nr:STAS domain-containing protein [Streptosporangium brasiliense]MDP9865934.1 anti-anti-sigma factor [Streptosporangium brasiliense]